MKARITIVTAAAVAALSLSLTAGAANGPDLAKRPVTHWWYSAHVLGPSRADMVIRPHVTGGPTSIRPHATAGWTRASS